MRLLRSLVVGLVLASCVPTPDAAPASGAPAPVAITDRTRAEIETVLQKRQTALARRDLPGFQSTIDLTRPAFRRCQQESFDVASRQGASSAGPIVGRVEAYHDTYLRAFVDDPGRGYVRLYFKRDGDHWVLTEPKSDELGGEKTKTVEGIEISYWGIDDDIVEGYARAGTRTRAFLLAVPGGSMPKVFALRFFPTRESAGLVNCGVVGFKSGNSTDPYLRFLRIWVASNFVDMSPLMLTFFQHEGLHWLQDQTIPGITARLDWWLLEGWPDYVGQSRDPLVFIKNTICATPTPTFKNLVDGPEAAQGFDPAAPPERTVQFYAFANTMVEYLLATFGDDSYFKLLTAYKVNVDPKVNYPQVLKVTPEAFYAGWLTWAKKKYC